MKLANSNDKTINPATEEKQDDIVTAVQAISGGGDGAILDGVTASIKATVHDYANSNPLAVVLKDTSGDYVSVGGGTQYSDADINADPTGTVAMGTDGANVYAVHTDTAGDLQVDVLTLPAVTGTVTANLSATDNAVLDDIALDTEAIKDSLETVGGQVVNLGTNNDVTVTGTVDLGATDNAVLDAIELDTTTIAGAVAGTEMQVDVVAALPAGTNAIGKLLPPDVDVTTNTNYAKKYYTSAGAVTDGIIWSPAAGKRWHIHTIFIQVSAAATVTLEDDLAAGDSVIWKAELAANAGLVMTFPEKYPWASGEDQADLLVTTNAGNIYITCSGIEI